MQRIELTAAARDAGRQRVAAGIAEPPQRNLHAAGPVRIAEGAERQVDVEAEAIARYRGALGGLASGRCILWSDASRPEERRRDLPKNATFDRPRSMSTGARVLAADLEGARRCEGEGAVCADGQCCGDERCTGDTNEAGDIEHHAAHSSPGSTGPLTRRRLR